MLCPTFPISVHVDVTKNQQASKMTSVNSAGWKATCHANKWHVNNAKQQMHSHAVVNKWFWNWRDHPGLACWLWASQAKPLAKMTHACPGHTTSSCSNQVFDIFRLHPKKRYKPHPQPMPSEAKGIHTDVPSNSVHSCFCDVKHFWVFRIVELCHTDTPLCHCLQVENLDIPADFIRDSDIRTQSKYFLSEKTNHYFPTCVVFALAEKVPALWMKTSWYDSLTEARDMCTAVLWLELTFSLGS